MKLTPSQRRELQRAAACPPPGVYRRPFYGTGSGLARKGWVSMMERLADAGLLSRFTDDGYEITEAGRKALED